MIRLILTDEQSRQFAEAQGPVTIVMSTGEVVAIVPRGFDCNEVIDAEKRLAIDEPRYTTAEVLAHLRSLDRG